MLLLKSFLVGLLALLVPVIAKSAPAASTETIALASVIEQVTQALNEYQNNRGAGAGNELPRLSSAEFDFKTTTATSGGISITLLIFKFGTTHEKDVVNDVTFAYKLPPPKTSHLQSSKPPPTLKDQLAQTIQRAAQAVKTSSTAAGLPFSTLTVNVSYGVKWDINAEGKPVISLVTLDLSGDRNKNTVQSVKLTFGQ